MGPTEEGPQSVPPIPDMEKFKFRSIPNIISTLEKEKKATSLNHQQAEIVSPTLKDTKHSLGSTLANWYAAY